MAMALNLQSTNGTGTGKKLGWLVWWTLEGKDLATADVVASAQAANIPSWMVGRISGRGEKAAWMVATQTGVKGIERPRTVSDSQDATVRYLTRDVNPTCRAIVREVLDPAQKIVGSYTVARVFFTEDPANRFQYMMIASNAAIVQEVEAILVDMAQDYQTRIGVTDYGRLRALIIDWLVKANRITVRGSGGVYLVPRPKAQQDADQVQGELVALANWVASAPIASLFSIVEVSDSGATTVEVFQKAAIDELKAELNDIDGKLTTWAKNPKMNAGSMAYSAGTMLDRVDELTKKTEALIEALGEEIGVVQIAMHKVTKRAKAIQFAAQFEVDQYQAQKTVAEAETKKNAPAKAAGKPVAAQNTVPPVPAPQTPLKAVETPQTLVKNWDQVKLEQAAVQVKTPTVKPQAGTNGKKAGVSGKGSKKL